MIISLIWNPSICATAAFSPAAIFLLGGVTAAALVYRLFFRKGNPETQRVTALLLAVCLASSAVATRYFYLPCDKNQWEWMCGDSWCACAKVIGCDCTDDGAGGGGGGAGNLPTD